MKRPIFILLTCVLMMAGLSYPSAAKEEKLLLTATASSVYAASYTADKAVDGNENTYWIGKSNLSPWWITFDMGRVEKAGRIVIKWYSVSYAPTSYNIQLSKDGTSWTNAFTAIKGADIDTKGINQEARYIRLYIASAASSYPMLKEVEIYRNITVPCILRFKGKLLDTKECPLDGLFKTTFSLYDNETGGSPLWQETQNSVPVERGILNVELGSVKPIDLKFNRQYWLAVKIGSNAEMIPRFRLTSVPYSFMSN